MSETQTRRLYCSRCLNTFEQDLDACANLACRRKRPSRGWGQIFAEGDVFDRNYRIHKMLAVGGAGVTYMGRELDHGGEEEVGPRLAIKVLLAARDQGPYVRRLATEAQIIQELDHANIVQYLGFVHRSGHSPYLLTRFEPGGSLLDHMRRVGTLSVRQAAVIGRQICWALEKAHERGIVHRDLKPENVLLTKVVGPGEDPVVRVADFGIAKVQGSLGTNLTRVGAFVGTPHYAAPEQFVGGAVTEAADVYAVGALLYFCMTARHVARFADRLDPEDSFQLLCDHLPPVVDKSTEEPGACGRINRVLAVAMEVDPVRRCTVVELDKMLEAVAAGRDAELPSRGAIPIVAAPALAPTASVLSGVAAGEAYDPMSPAPPAPLATAPPDHVGPRRVMSDVGEAAAVAVRSEPTLDPTSSAAFPLNPPLPGQPAVSPVQPPAPPAEPALSSGAGRAGAPMPEAPVASAPPPTPPVAKPKTVEDPPTKPKKSGRGVMGCLGAFLVLLLLGGGLTIAGIVGLVAFLPEKMQEMWASVAGADGEVTPPTPEAQPKPTTKPKPGQTEAPKPVPKPDPAPKVAPAGGGEPIEVTAEDKNYAHRRAYESVRNGIDGRKSWLLEKCPGAKSTKLSIVLVVEADGKTRSAEVLASPEKSCLEENLGRLSHTVQLNTPIRVRLDVQL